VASLFGHTQVVNGFTASNRLITLSPDPVNNAANSQSSQAHPAAIRDLWSFSTDIYFSHFSPEDETGGGSDLSIPRVAHIVYPGRYRSLYCPSETGIFSAKFALHCVLYAREMFFTKASDDPISLTLSFYARKNPCIPMSFKAVKGVLRPHRVDR